MIFEEDLEKQKTTKKIKVQCDFCGIFFERLKWEVLRGRKIIAKDSCGNKNCISLKRKESNIQKYGVENPSQNKEIKRKQEETSYKKYGCKTPSQNLTIKNKMAQTNLKKYGNKCSLHSTENKIKTKETWKNKYSCDHPFAAPEIRDKIKITMQKKYGDYYTRTEIYREKTKKTCLEKYGFEHSAKSESTKEKRKKTNIIKYGHEYPSQNKEIIEKIFASGHQLKIYGKAQKEIKKYLEEISSLKFESIRIEGKEIDIFNKDKNIGIEYCGLFWHNEDSPEPRDKNYHYNKYKLCESKNIRLITIFEDEWIYKKQQCKNYIRSIFVKFEKKIFARKCEIKEINNEISNNFYNQYHIQGKPNNTKVSFGLYYKEELLAVMSLGRHHRKSEDIILNRLCFKDNHQIIGGASKLLNACIVWCKKNNINKIVTWSDNRWSKGKIYEKMNFSLSKDLGPDYSYVNLNKRNCRLSKQSQKKSNTKCPKNMTEKEWAKKNKFSRIWDCGKKRWTFIVKDEFDI
jgi:hypothetical protein